MLYPLPLIPSATEIPYFVYWPDGLDKPIITEQRPEDVNNNDVLCCRYEVSEQILYYLTVRHRSSHLYTYLRLIDACRLCKVFATFSCKNILPSLHVYMKSF